MKSRWRRWWCERKLNHILMILCIPYLTFDTFEFLFRDSGDHKILRPPQRADASRLFRHSRREFELIAVYLRIGGVSGTEKHQVCHFTFKSIHALYSSYIRWNAVPHSWTSHAERIFIQGLITNAQSLRRGGTFNVRPIQGWHSNRILSSLGAIPLQIFHMWRTIKSSLRRCKDMSPNFFNRSQ